MSVVFSITTLAHFYAGTYWPLKSRSGMPAVPSRCSDRVVRGGEPIDVLTSFALE